MAEAPLPEHDGTSLVLVGSFNPRIFHPSWFVRNDLLAPEAESTANIQVVSNEVCAFETDWFRMEVLAERFSLRSLSAPIVEAMRDLLAGTFTLLRHTPIQKMGLNTHTHFALGAEDTWHRFGHKLLPKQELWSPVLEGPRTLVAAVEGRRTDKYQGFIRVKVEPSAQVANGIYIETNDEYQSKELEPPSTDWVLDILKNDWDASRKRAKTIRSHLVAQALLERANAS